MNAQTIDSTALGGFRILLIISGGIAAYKSLDLIRRLRERGAELRCVLTAGGAEFITPLSVASLSESPVYTDLWSLKDESEMGHIRLSRECDLIIIAPASANILAQMANGLASDLATTTLLAADKPILIAPAMNQMMWGHAATQANIATLRQRGVHQIGPGSGEMACGETGSGRMAEPLEIVAAATDLLRGNGPLRGKRAIVTSGPTVEPLDPVRFISNRSSGKQGQAIAASLARAGAETIMISGPTGLAPPPGVKTIFVETAQEMLDACVNMLPADIAVCAAAVSDWRAADMAGQKLKKTGDGPPSIALAENPDILASLSTRNDSRPALVVGFAAETENIIEHARAKIAKKGCDWLLANDVGGDTGTFGGDNNRIRFLTRDGRTEDWPDMRKTDVANELVNRIAQHFAQSA
ncbi:MAG TPA: bifunctional phosphopantothenoylcysteine decarboxylase/phosphopantothenate--cysteine ligase CoaBC [Rhodospirillaceae bacterium]|nr:bifunctional phosphopantothenoylcysteine decarboxylase/phosphopantothenate--cysteine ligase CoaBC [Alphaproteobacteria bacterium]MAS47157.1 bifunctional phosphopantothenoylcysteine decarboxylase/phosphopantothenate--cysteine ligase CoaBC [Alphaproteobacteria bacterium]MBN53295.1 bifunctional phosphopantothenoylcysteine decarboxylase/phosphopantothenate--cysteine ligase CoaBC [Alphaproteobacteria bacterium]OUT42608.1 MAG: bifunctional phosphopantothenoylcysteine decarboxylase/phosphopantothena